MKGFWLFVILIFFGCQNQETPVQVDKSGMISHIVLFNTHDSLSTTQLDSLHSILSTLEDIPEVNFFEIGTFKHLNDPRALSSYEFVIQMEFDDEGAYQKYQSSDKHLAAKKMLGPYLAAPPISYDYLID